MRSFLHFALALLIVSARVDVDTQSAAGSSRQSAPRVGDAVVPDRVIRLFNGRDLTGWKADVPAKDANPHAPDSFIVRNGTLVSLGEPRGHLLTETAYRDYRLEVEYRFAGKGGNCGVLVHASRLRALSGMFPQSIEVQMAHQNAGDFWCIEENIEVPDMETRRPRQEGQKFGGSQGDARRILNLTDNSEKPLGEWNTMVIEARGRTVKVWVNGDLVNEGFGSTADRGKIALQAEGAEVEFRRVDIGPLPKASPASVPARKIVDLDSATIADLNAAFKGGTLTSEKLVQMCLARIQSYDRQGPSLRAVITVNPKALDTARALDAERNTKGPRSPLHGIPMVLKDNFDTADMPTTGGSVLLEGSMPPDDAFLVKKLRAAGAVVIAKVNLSEFASGVAHSSLGGQIRNPHDLTRTPSGSSGGTGAAIAAAYAVAGLGTDTGGSIRGPSTANGIVGLKPTHGLLSRDGIIPLALSFDTAGPMARTVYDVAAALGVMTGVDPADAATRKSEGRFETDYIKYLKADALKGARIGIARDFLGQDPDVDWVVDAALDTMRREGATVVDVRFPRWLRDSKGEFYNAVRYPEFTAQIADYLATIGPGYPKTIDQLIDRATRVNALRADGAGPNPGRWGLMKREAGSGTLDDYRYTSVRDHGLPMVRAVVDGILSSEKLDAIVYPTAPRRPALIASPPEVPGGGPESASNIANLAGFPDLIVPAGFTGDDLPVGLSFLGTAFSEPKLLALGFSFEQATRARRLPVHTPKLHGESITIP